MDLINSMSALLIDSPFDRGRSIFTSIFSSLKKRVDNKNSKRKTKYLFTFTGILPANKIKKCYPFNGYPRRCSRRTKLHASGINNSSPCFRSFSVARKSRHYWQLWFVVAPDWWHCSKRYQRNWQCSTIVNGSMFTVIVEHHHHKQLMRKIFVLFYLFTDFHIVPSTRPLTFWNHSRKVYKHHAFTITVSNKASNHWSIEQHRSSTANRSSTKTTASQNIRNH